MTTTAQETAGSIDTYETSSDATDLDRTSVPAVVDPGLSAPIVASLERAWAAIGHRHSDLPQVVMVLASGSDGAPSGWLKLGHFAAMRWETRDNVMPEVFIGGEGLARGPIGVLGTLLHEAAHALAHAREIKDTSRQGRYHNARYAELARSLGLDVAQIAPIGWSNTTVTEATADHYAATIADLAAALKIFRRSESDLFRAATGDDRDQGDGDTTRTPRRPATPTRDNGNGVAALCGCGRRIRVTASVLDLGPITCALCGDPFATS